MLRIPGKIPIAISPFFWVTAGLIGWINSMGLSSPLLLTLIWMFVIFVSILVHELGHALMALYFGQEPRIEFVAFGGLTYPEGKRVHGWREFLVVLNGPFFGFLLFLLAFFLLSTGFFKGAYLVYTLKIFVWVNLFWTIVNLLPVMPLDGGQLLRVIFESIFGAKGLKYAVCASMIISVIISLGFFLIGYFIVGAIFFIFAFQNFDAWRRARIISESDRDDNLTMEMKEIEELLMHDRTQEVESRLEEMRKKAKKGLIFNLTSQHLANFKAEKNDYQAVYELLKPIKKHLSPESHLQLHRAAYEMQDYPLVVELSGACFQMIPDPDIALRSAESCAVLRQVEPTIGWLKAARKGGVIDLQSIIAKPLFDAIRQDTTFQAFTESI